MRSVGSKFARSALALGAALAVGACSESTGIDLEDQALLLDMALVAADATIEDVNTWGLPFGFAAGPQGIPGLGDRGKGAPGGKRGIGAELSGTREVTHYDADGIAQDAYDELTTASIHFFLDVEGEVERDAWSASIDRTRDMTVSGLEGEETHRTFNGTGDEDVSRSRHLEDGDRTYSMTGSFTYSDVVVPVPGSDPRYPISGTITRSMTSTRTNGDDTNTRSVDVTITFDGDETATIVVNGEEMEIDLTTREGRNPLRKKRGGRGG